MRLRTAMMMLVLGGVLVAGCHHPPVKPSGAGTSAVGANGAAGAAGVGSGAAGAAGAAGAGANSGPLGANGSAGGADAGPGDELANHHTVYFDFDSSEIRADSTAVIAAHARYLVAHPNARARLEGNTDERGTREYNIGLGERRALAVEHALTLQGVADTQLKTVSYGEERPAVPGHDEDAWAKNRRVEIVYGE